MIERRKMKERELQKKIDAERQGWAKEFRKASECLKTKKPKHGWTAKEHDFFLYSLCRNKTEKIPKRKKDLIALFDDWKDDIPIPIEEWGGNCAFNDDTEENDETMVDNLDADVLDVAI